MKETKDKLSPIMEDYLETIHALAKENGFARVGEIAERMNVKSPSVNSAVKFLSTRGFVNHKKYGYVGLTKEGESFAAEVQSKHDALFKFLTEFLMLDKSIAQEDACRIEHVINPKTFENLTKFIDFINIDGSGESPNWLKKYRSFLKTGKKSSCKKRPVRGKANV